MKITLIGSTQYKEKFMAAKTYYEAKGYKVLMPAFDDHPTLDELGVMKYNLNQIKLGDVIGVIWDARSPGTWGDFCMAFALGKKIIPVYIEEKTMAGVIRKYAEAQRLDIPRLEKADK